METALLSMAQQFSGLPMEALIGGPLNAAANANAAMAVTQTKFLLDTCFIKTHIPKKDKVDPKPADPTKKTPTKEVIGTPEVPEHEEYSPIMIVMSLTKPVITPGTKGSPGDPNAKPVVPPTDPTATVIQNVTTQFNLPMLTIIPLNSLGVDNVDISFEMEVKSSFSEEQTEEKTKELKSEGSFEAKVGWGPFSVTVKGSASYDSKDSSTHNTHYEKSNSAKYTVKVHAGQLPIPKGVNTIIEAFTQAIQPITVSA
jgi:hypothetical protein